MALFTIRTTAKTGESGATNVPLETQKNAKRTKGPRWKELQILEKTFRTREEIFDYYHDILRRYPPGTAVSSSEAAMIIELVKKGHPNAAKKLGSADGSTVEAVKVAYHPVHTTTTCFVLVRKDATEEDVSYVKCVDTLFPVGSKKRPREEESFSPGLLVQVTNLPTGASFADVRTTMSQFGNVAFVKMDKGSNSAIVQFTNAADATKASQQTGLVVRCQTRSSSNGAGADTTTAAEQPSTDTPADSNQVKTKPEHESGDHQEGGSAAASSTSSQTGTVESAVAVALVSGEEEKKYWQSCKQDGKKTKKRRKQDAGGGRGKRGHQGRTKK